MPRRPPASRCCPLASARPRSGRSSQQHRQRIQEIPPAERRPAAFVGRFGRVEGPAKVEPLLAVARAWRPDLIVHEAADLAGPLAAAALGIGSAVHSFGRIMPRVCYERAHEEVAPLWHAAGLEPEPLCGAYRGAYVDICPPSFGTEGPPEGVPSYALRPEAGAGGDGAPPGSQASPIRSSTSRSAPSSTTPR